MLLEVPCQNRVCFYNHTSIFSLRFSLSSSLQEPISSGASEVCSSGICEHVAYDYARRGARLVLAARREKSLREVADTARSLGAPEAIVVPADVSNIDDCKRLIEERGERGVFETRQNLVGGPVAARFSRSLKQHNGELNGGAKATQVGRPWICACIVRGFESKFEACKFEFKWKSVSSKMTRKRNLKDDGGLHLLQHRNAALQKVEGSIDCIHLEFDWKLELI